MSKKINLDEVPSKIKDGMVVMVGGFLSNGSPKRIIDAIEKSGVKDLTLVCNDTAFPDRGIGRLIYNGQVKKLIVSYIATTPKVAEMMNNGEIEVEFVPQGTLAERIRSAGYGLGGVLTPTGVGTIVAEGKEVMVIDGKEYLLEKPLHADVAIIGASVADETGNLFYRGTSQNFNPVMATAADLVIAEAEEIVPAGSLMPETIHTPNVLVDYIVEN